MLIKFALSLFFLLLPSCDDPTSSSEDLMQKLYVCDEGSDRVIIFDATSDNLSQIKTIDINFADNDDLETQISFIKAIDEIIKNKEKKSLILINKATENIKT